MSNVFKKMDTDVLQQIAECDSDFEYPELELG